LLVEPGLADAWFNLGIAHAKAADAATDEQVRKTNLNEEKRAYEKAVELAPTYHKGWYNLAITYNKLSLLDDEIRAYEKALEVRPEYPQALFNLAYAYEEKGATDKAVNAWERYVEIATKLPTEQEYLVTAREQLGRLRL
jgi:superkiller protein 3